VAAVFETAEPVNSVIPINLKKYLYLNEKHFPLSIILNVSLENRKTKLMILTRVQFIKSYFFVANFLQRLMA
jgi:hypothetical protein